MLSDPIALAELVRRGLESDPEAVRRSRLGLDRAVKAWAYAPWDRERR
jgi:hypothetical protein